MYMKRITALALIGMMAAAMLTGCGENAASTTSQVASDAVSGAGRVVDDIGDGVSQAVSDSNSAITSTVDNGEVSDRDGVIGDNDDTESASEQDATEEVTSETSE